MNERNKYGAQLNSSWPETQNISCEARGGSVASRGTGVLAWLSERGSHASDREEHESKRVIKRPTEDCTGVEEEFLTIISQFKACHTAEVSGMLSCEAAKMS